MKDNKNHRCQLSSVCHLSVVNRRTYCWSTSPSLRAFPDARVTFEPDLKRQSIVDSWPVDVDDAAARADWGWEPGYDMRRAFDEYLIPAVSRRYRQRG